MVKKTDRLQEIKNSILETQQKLQGFEEKYKISTEKFLNRFETDQLEHQLNMDFDEWMGEAWMLDKLQNKYKELQEIELC
ncbi:hypothetical protein cce_0185 [Crocosphaera subtropica ATCC 51142]|uniref:Uncharacterized protein n=1 Tax=Crocosphaera subtropica (strain ATCC 51142 / BH68) TaxID=43989 RepID=B1X036_CROS5|nr:hypothetical protein [Crocosphaera subtropica]ACB49537.1 hypothetical protein cce_0185 [Crocosphaera subtropica ATCC 51142]